MAERTTSPQSRPVPSSWLRDALLLAAGYLTLAGVSLISLNTIPATRDRWIVAGILLAFGLLMGLWPEKGNRKRQPHLYLAVQSILVLSAYLLSLPWSVFPLLFFILSAEAMVGLPLSLGLFWIGAFVLITGAILTAEAGWPQGPLVALAYAGGYAFFGAFANALRQAETARQESQKLVQELQQAHRQLQEYAAQVEELAVAAERTRLAREMHDTVGHHLTVSVVQLDAAQRLMDDNPKRSAAMVGTAREEVKKALEELRRAVAALRAPLEADAPLLQALTHLVEGFREATGLAVHLQLPEELPTLPGPHRLTLYRAAQEALTNVHRHARARQVWLELRVEPKKITLCVADDGTGFPKEGPQIGFGLRGLQERASQLHGQLHLESHPGGGAQVHVVLPLPQVTSHA